MNRRGHAGGLALVALCVAAAARIAPVAFERAEGRDLAEFRSVAENLLAGRGFVSDIRAFRVSPAGVGEYAGYVRAPLPSAAIASARFVLGPGGERVVGPLCFFATLALLWDVLALSFGRRAATWGAVAAGLHPALREVSLAPLTEPPTLLLLTGGVWAAARARSPAAAGAFCAAAFLARPNSALAACVVGALVAFGVGPASGKWRRAAIFAAAWLAGPAALAAINLAHGAPAWTTPQSFLFRLIDYGDAVHYARRGPVFDSAAALLAARPGEVAERIAKNALHYAAALGDATTGLATLLPVAPLAWVGFRRRPRRAAPALALLAAGAVDLGFYSGAWFTFDAERFLALPILAVAATLPAAAFRSRLPPRISAAIVLCAIAPWIADDAYRAWTVARERSLGRPLSNNVERLWGPAERAGLAEELAYLVLEDVVSRDRPLVSNEPWLAWTLSRAPGVLLPYDLRREEWLDRIDATGSRALLIHAGDWPAPCAANLAALEETLPSGGWRIAFAEGPFRLWLKPEFDRAVAAAGSPTWRSKSPCSRATTRHENGVPERAFGVRRLASAFAREARLAPRSRPDPLGGSAAQWTPATRVAGYSPRHEASLAAESDGEPSHSLENFPARRSRTDENATIWTAEAMPPLSSARPCLAPGRTPIPASRTTLPASEPLHPETNSAMPDSLPYRREAWPRGAERRHGLRTPDPPVHFQASLCREDMGTSKAALRNTFPFAFRVGVAQYAARNLQESVGRLPARLGAPERVSRAARGKPRGRKRRRASALQSPRTGRRFSFRMRRSRS